MNRELALRLKRVVLWFGMTFIFGEALPVAGFVIASMLTNTNLSIRQIIGHATIFLIGFTILVATLTDLLIAGLWRRHLGPMLSLIVLLVVVGFAVGVAANPELREKAADPVKLNEDYWLWFELALTIAVLVTCALIKAWALGQRGEEFHENEE
jgi:hypothetical protein